MAEYDAKGLQDKDNNNVNFTPTHYMKSGGSKESIETALAGKQDSLSTEANDIAVSDGTTFVKTVSGAKLVTTTALKVWTYIKGKLGFDSNTSRYGISISGTASMSK